MSDFRYTRPNSMPPIVKNLLIVNVLVFLAQLTLGRQFDIEKYFALHDVRSSFFEPYQVISYMFLHSTSTYFHLIFNMLAVWMFGSKLETMWGSKRFLIYYLVTGIGAAVLHLIVLYIQMAPIFAQVPGLSLEDQYWAINSADSPLNFPTVGASGAVFGCLAAYGYLFPNTLVYLYFAIPIKAKWLVLGYAAVELYLGFANNPGDNTAHFAHLGGALAGIILVLIWNKTNRKTLY